MCGIVGFWDFRKDQSPHQNQDALMAMTQAIASRGPDAFGVWDDSAHGIYIGHRRLSILDLSEHGAQPMISLSGRYVITYNGEVYNYQDLAKDLETEGYAFKGHSDTEVLLAACEAWGVEAACERFNGMFAFALWDRQERELFLVRDRVGIKPLYWGFNKDIFYFGSQLKSFHHHPQWQGRVCPEAMTTYLTFNYIPAPQSIFSGIQKLIPGTILHLKQGREPQITPYWHALAFKNVKTIPSTAEGLETLLLDSVSKRMIADVPLGAFLSGGIDSSLVVALMQKQSTRPVKTFSIGFQEEAYNEAIHARAVANHLGTDHQDLYLSPQETMDIIPSLSDFYDEPFADVSQLPTYLVSKLARTQVTVALSGDGGDELFLGYDRYAIGNKLYPFHKYIPYPLRAAFAQIFHRMTPGMWSKIVACLPQKYQFSQIAEKAYKLSDALSARSDRDFCQSIVSIWNQPHQILGFDISSREHQTLLDQGRFHPSIVSHMSYLDLKTFLPECILTKVDRASMALGLEVRVPLLDYRVVEFGYRWNRSPLVSVSGPTKALLRSILYNHVPREDIES